jgi:DNA repair protein RecO (recombination protein O)
MERPALECEAIVLDAIAFKEDDCIVTIFSKERGLLKLFVKGKKTPLYLKNALCSPLTVGNFTFLSGKGELGHFLEGAIVEQFLEVRSHFEQLQTALRCLEAILRSQLPEKAAPSLYMLLLSFLEKLPFALCLETYFTAFLLKLLRHEGLLELPPQKLGLSEEDYAHFLTLSTVRSFHTLFTYKVSKNLSQKVETLFERSV